MRPSPLRRARRITPGSSTSIHDIALWLTMLTEAHVKITITFDAWSHLFPIEYFHLHTDRIDTATVTVTNISEMTELWDVTEGKNNFQVKLQPGEQFQSTLFNLLFADWWWTNIGPEFAWAGIHYTSMVEFHFLQLEWWHIEMIQITVSSFHVWIENMGPEPVTIEKVIAGIPVQACPWDCGDNDGFVGIVDFLALLGQWGQAGPCDFDGDGIVGITDFLDLLGHWGPCP